MNGMSSAQVIERFSPVAIELKFCVTNWMIPPSGT